MAGQQSMKNARPEVGRQRPSLKTPHAQPRQVLGEQSAMLRRLGPKSARPMAARAPRFSPPCRPRRGIEQSNGC